MAGKGSRVRTIIRAKGQVTLPRQVRQALHVAEGDDVEFRVAEDGTVTVAGLKVVPAEQAWFWTAEWQDGEREASEQLARGEGTFYESDEEFLESLR